MECAKAGKLDISIGHVVSNKKEAHRKVIVVRLSPNELKKHLEAIIVRIFML